MMYTNTHRTSLMHLCVLFLTLMTLAATGARADDGAVPEKVNAAVAQTRLTAEEKGERWDWLQLTSGEWLKGTLKTLYKNDLEFDSDELGLLTFEFTDVQLLQTDNQYRVRLVGEESHKQGRLNLTGDTLIIENSVGRTEHKRADIIAIAPSFQHAIDYWSAKISFGSNLRRGNTEQFDYNTNLVLRRRTAVSRFRSDFIGSASTTDGIDTADNQRLSASYDIFFTRHFFVRPAAGEILRDPFQNIDLKWTYGASLGHYIIDNATTEWDYAVGLGYQRLNYLSVSEGSDTSSRSGAFLFSTSIDHELSGSTDLSFAYRIQWAKRNAGGYTHHAVTSVDFEFIGDLDLGVTYVWDFIEFPEVPASGEAPNQNDVRLSVNISYSFN